jgi:hypothetical protein
LHRGTISEVRSPKSDLQHPLARFARPSPLKGGRK